MELQTLKRSFFQRIFGISATARPADPTCWSFTEGRIVLNLGRTPELASPGGAVRLEGGGLPFRLLIVHGEDGSYHAFQNKCRHFGRRLDPVPGTRTVQCCSVNKTTYDLEGAVLAGPAKGPLVKYAVEKEGEQLTVSLA